MKRLFVFLWCGFFFSLAAFAEEGAVLISDAGTHTLMVHRELTEDKDSVSRQAFRAIFQSEILPQYRVGRDKRWYWTAQWPEGGCLEDGESMALINGSEWGMSTKKAPTEAEAWTRYQKGGRFMVRHGVGQRVVSCPTCDGTGRVDEPIPEGLKRPTRGRRMSSDDGMRSTPCKRCFGAKHVTVPVSYDYAILGRPEKVQDQEGDRRNLASFLGAPLGREISPHRVSALEKRAGAQALLWDYFPRQDFLCFGRYFVATVPGSLEVHSVIAYNEVEMGNQQETFDAVANSIRAAYGAYCDEVAEGDGRTIRFICKANPDRQILVAWRPATIRTTQAYTAQTIIPIARIYLQATDVPLQGQAGGVRVPKKLKNRIKAEDLEDAVDVL